MFLFHLNQINSIDHLVPIIWKFLEKKNDVMVIMLSDYDYKNDYRIQFLCNYSRFSIRKVRWYDKLRNKIVTNSKIRKMYQIRYFGNLLKWLLIQLIFKNSYFMKNTFKAVFFEWGAAYSVNFYDSKVRGIPVIALPHGSNTLKDFLSSKTLLNNAVENKFPDLSSQKDFDLYIIQDYFHAEMVKQYGIPNLISEVWGNCRYSSTWHKINLEIAPTYSLVSDESKIKILLFSTSVEYNVYESLFVELIEKLSRMDFVQLVICGRMGESIDGIENNISENVIFNTNDSPTSLIRWSDLVINFSSSVVYEAINQDKPIIHAKYLHSNETIFDNSDFMYVANSTFEVIEYIELIQKKQFKQFSENSKVSFLSKELYCNRNEYDVPDFYYTSIQKFLKNIESRC